MTAPQAPARRGRSAAAVLAGFVATAVLSLGADFVLHATRVFPAWGQPMSDDLFVGATGYRMVFTVLGGYLTARWAPSRPMSHALVLGLVGTLVAAAGAVATWNAGPAFGPRWYPVLLVVAALPCVWAGGRLYVESRR